MFALGMHPAGPGLPPADVGSPYTFLFCGPITPDCGVVAPGPGIVLWLVPGAVPGVNVVPAGDVPGVGVAPGKVAGAAPFVGAVCTALASARTIAPPKARFLVVVMAVSRLAAPQPKRCGQSCCSGMQWQNATNEKAAGSLPRGPLPCVLPMRLHRVCRGRRAFQLFDFRLREAGLQDVAALIEPEIMRGYRDGLAIAIGRAERDVNL